MCWHYNKQELQLFQSSGGTPPSCSGHPVRALAAWYFQLQLLLWVLLSLANFGVYDVFE